MDNHAEKLAPKLRAMGERIKRLAAEDRTEHLLQVIHRPGWTTIAEVMLVESMIEVIDRHAEMLGRAQAGLVAAAEQVRPSTAAT